MPQGRSPPSLHSAATQSIELSGPAMNAFIVTCQIKLLKGFRPFDELNENTARRLEVRPVEVG